MNTLHAVGNETQKLKSVRGKIWRERPVTEDVLFKGADECGRSGWFLRVTVSGLYPRRVGPYRTKGQAVKVLEEFIAKVKMEALCDLENDQQAATNQAYVVEEVPPLVGSSAERIEGVV